MWETIGAMGLQTAGTIFQNQQNKKLMREQMAWQENLANTAHQREVADLKAAGLNPILSAGGSGATSPSGSLASISNPLEGAAGTILQAKQLKLANKLGEQQIQSSIADVKNTETATKKTEAEISAIKAELPAIRAESNARVKTAQTTGTVSEIGSKTAGGVKQAYDYLTSGHLGEKAFDLQEEYVPKVKSLINRIKNKFKRFINQGSK